METINLHGLNLAEALAKLESGLNSAFSFNVRIIRVIHGQGKHSEFFPVIKSNVRRWLEESEFAANHIESVFRGEDGSPYTGKNPGETIVVLKIGDTMQDYHAHAVIEWEEEESREARKNAKGIRADRLRTARRRGP
ncbi:MAG TPA: Smr/MutS family protein [Bacillota bacterium]|nr:Smr/MutS family protein [Bacillota bacterium]